MEGRERDAAELPIKKTAAKSGHRFCTSVPLRPCSSCIHQWEKRLDHGGMTDCAYLRMDRCLLQHKIKPLPAIM